jgi:hypothetical protein
MLHFQDAQATDAWSLQNHLRTCARMFAITTSLTLESVDSGVSNQQLRRLSPEDMKFSLRQKTNKAEPYGRISPYRRQQFTLVYDLRSEMSPSNTSILTSTWAAGA